MKKDFNIYLCSLSVCYIVFEYRTKVRSSIYNVSQMRTRWYIFEIFFSYIVEIN